MKRRVRWEVVIFVVGAIYQLAVIADLSRSPFFGNPILDARYQVEWAFALASGRDPHPVFFQSPLYSYLVAGFVKLFGWHVWGIVIVQWLMMLGVEWLVWRTLDWLGVARPIRLAALVFVVFYPLLPYYAAMLHKTALEIALHALVLALGVRLIVDEGLGWRGLAIAALFGLSCGIAALVRATFEAFAILPCLLLRRPRWLRIAAVALGFAIPFGWAQLHNVRGAGEWVPLQTSYGFTLFLGNNEWNTEGAQMLVPDLSNRPMEEEASSKEYAEKHAGRTLTTSEVNAWFVGEVKRYVGTSFGQWFASELRKLHWYWHREELPDDDCYRCLADETPTLAANPLGWGWIGLLAPAALALIVLGWIWERHVKRPELYAALFALALFGVLMVFYVSSRLRAGHALPWIVVVALGADAARRHWRDHGPAIFLATVIGIAPGVWLLTEPCPTYPPDETTLKQCWILNDLDRFDEATAAAEGLQDPGRRRAMLEKIAELRRDTDPKRPRHLVSAVIPLRK
jgi:4-amino-4-deoxy-L-arabinose transferase-like glycosyltransferase